MRHIFTLFCFLVIFLSAYSQNDRDTWDKNYNEINVTDLFHFEKLYADSVDHGLIEGKYYMRMDNFRFSALFTGNKRKISDSIKASMIRVYKVYGNHDFLPIIDKVKYEYEFLIDNNTYWISMQSVLDKPFMKEIKKDDNVYLYCLFLNEHGIKGELYNSFLISEFSE